MFIQAPGKRGEALHNKEPWQGGHRMLAGSWSQANPSFVILQTLLGCTHSCWEPWDSRERQEKGKTKKYL